MYGIIMKTKYLRKMKKGHIFVMRILNIDRTNLKYDSSEKPPKLSPMSRPSAFCFGESPLR